jgi:hypothetical protein
MGRPPKVIDKKQFESLCGIQCTLEEVCQFFDCDEKTLNKWCKENYRDTFSHVFKTKRGVGRVSLRRAQYQAALKGNSSLLIWLGKQYLDQTDSPAMLQAQQEVEDLTPLADLLKGDDDGE